MSAHPVKIRTNLNPTFYYIALYLCTAAPCMLPTKDAIVNFPTRYECSSNMWNYLFEGFGPMLSLT